MCFLFFFTTKVIFENKDSVFKQMWSLTVARQKTYGMFCFSRTVPNESDSVPMRDQVMFNSGGKFQGWGARSSAQPASWSLTGSSECSRFQHGTSSRNLGLCHNSKELLRVISHLCKGSWPDLQLPTGHWTKQPLLILLLQGNGARWRHKISESQTTFPSKTTILHCI